MTVNQLNLGGPKMRKKESQPEKVIIKTYSYAFKKEVIDLIENGRISINQASKVYEISRSTIQTWMKKYGNFEKKLKHMGGKSAQQEIRELKKKIRELESKELIYETFIDMVEKDYGISKKKLLPESLQLFLKETKNK